MPAPIDDPRALELVGALSDAVKRLSTSDSLSDLLQEIVCAGRTLLDARYAALAVFGPDGSISEFVTEGLAEAEREAIGGLPRGCGLLGEVIRKAKSVRTPDISTHPKAYGFPPNHPTMRSFLGVPIRLGDEVLGNLYVTDRKNAPSFTSEDEWIATLLAEHAALAVERARLSEARETFISIAAHELRTPIGGMRLAAETARHQAKAQKVAPELTALLDELYTGVTDLEDEVEDLLDFSQLDRGNLTLHRSTVDLRDIAQKACARLVGSGTDRRVSAELGDAPIKGRWDRRRLQRALANVLENALRYSEPDSEVDLSLSADDAWASAVVKDCGPGIPPEDQEQIWRPYGRGAADRADHRSSGIGLYIVREIVKAHGGRVELESAPGRGATFTLSFPRRPKTSPDVG